MTTATDDDAVNDATSAPAAGPRIDETTAMIEAPREGRGSRRRKGRFEDSMRGENITWLILFAALMFCMWRAFAG